MLQLNNLPLPNKLGIQTSFVPYIRKAITARGAAIQNMSGYPLGSHVIGRLMEMFDFTSVETLLTSIKKVRDIVRLASDVLHVIPLARIDKYQLMQTEIQNFIDTQKDRYQFANLGPNEVNLAAYCITSSEASDSIWTLMQATEVTENFWIKLHDLYKQLGVTGISTTSQTVDPTGLNQMWQVDTPTGDRSTSFIYDPHEDNVVSITQLPRVRAMMDAYNAAIIARPSSAGELNALMIKQVDDMRTIYSCFYMHVVDHMAMLMTDVNIWSSFVSPRRSPDPAQNVERAKSLKLFASYLHTLLLFPHIASIELIKQNYDKLQSWLTTLPPLDPHYLQSYEDTVHTFDIFNARGLATEMLGLIDTTKDELTNASFVGISGELTTFFGLRESAEAALASASAINIPSDIANLTEFSKGTYDAVLLSQPIGAYTMVTDFTTAMTARDAMLIPLRDAQSQIISATPRFYSTELVSKLKTMTFNIPFKLAPKVPYSNLIDAFTSATFSGGKLKYREKTPLKTVAFEREMRRGRINKIFTSTWLNSLNCSSMPEYIINEDIRTSLMADLQSNFVSLAPHHLAYGPESFRPEMVATDRELLRRLIVLISNQSFEMVTRTISNEYLRKIWATSVSAFASLYVVDPLIKDAADFAGIASSPDALAASHIIGYGLPYGMTYAEVVAFQPNPEPNEYILIGSGVWMRFHKRIPRPTTTLSVCTEFVTKSPSYYYRGNQSENSGIDVTEWVVTDSLWNFCLVPLPPDYSVPRALLDRRYIYLKEAIYLQTNMLYVQTKNYDDDYSCSIPIVEHSWQYDKVIYWTKFKKFGDYSNSPAPALPSSGPEIPNEITKLISKFESEEVAANNSDPVHKLASSKSADLPNVTVTKLPETKFDMTGDRMDYGKKQTAGGPNQKKKQNNKSKDKGKPMFDKPTKPGAEFKDELGDDSVTDK